MSWSRWLNRRADVPVTCLLLSDASEASAYDMVMILSCSCRAESRPPRPPTSGFLSMATASARFCTLKMKRENQVWWDHCCYILSPTFKGWLGLVFKGSEGNIFQNTLFFVWFVQDFFTKQPYSVNPMLWEKNRNKSVISGRPVRSPGNHCTRSESNDRMAGLLGLSTYPAAFAYTVHSLWWPESL